MEEFLKEYRPVTPTTWVYLSSLLTLALYFKFGRLWSLRNLDLLGLISLAPGWLFVAYGLHRQDPSIEHAGYIWLFVAGGFFLVRLLMDPVMVRRPLLEPNLSVGGMTFLGVSLFVFLMANVATNDPVPPDVVASQGVGAFLNQKAAQQQKLEKADANDAQDGPVDQPIAARDSLASRGPGYPLLFFAPRIAAQAMFPDDDSDSGADAEPSNAASADAISPALDATVRITAILAHFAVLIGMALIGYLHFENYKTGIAAALLYLMLPYTAREIGNLQHVLPAALLVWAVLCYRRPMISGLLMGLAFGVFYYPLFLLPLWFSFYWRRGSVRFLFGILITLTALMGVLAYFAVSFDVLLDGLRRMFGWWLPKLEGLRGFWNPDFNVPAYRIPVLAAFVALAGSFAVWPAQKNLGTLLSCSAAVMLATQFWHPHGGGLYIAWYLPMLLLTIFRPNLEDRVALTVLQQGWRPKWVHRVTRLQNAA